MATGSQHFRRQPKGGIVVTERDVAMLQQIGEHRFLSAQHLMDLVGNGRHPNVIRGRLRKLFDHGHLHRLRHPGEDGVSGSKPRVYGLAPGGARELLRRTGQRFPAETTSRTFLEHALQVSDVMVALALSGRRHGVGLIPFPEILAQAPLATRARARENPALAGGWSVTFQHARKPRKLAIYPDAIFGVRLEVKKRSFFCLEADRGTEPVVRKNLLRSSMYKKFLAYYNSWVQWQKPAGGAAAVRGVAPPYGFRNPRILTVVATKKDPASRIDNLMRVAQEVAPNAPGLFLFTTHQAVVAGDVLTHKWRNAKGAAVQILK